MKELVWINEHAREVGGCERYIAATAQGLAKRGYRNTLLYNPELPSSAAFLSQFDAAYPLVEPEQQLLDLPAELLFVHQWREPAILTKLTQLGLPTIRFLHDQQISCLRRHKMTGTKGEPCQQPTGSHCYPCLGFVQWRPSFKLRSLQQLRREQRAVALYDRILVASDYMRRELSAEGIKDNVETLPLYTEEPPQTRYRKEKNLLLYTGRLSKEKGLLNLLDELKAVRLRHRMVMIGDGPERHAIEKKAKALGLRIDFLGARPPAQVKEWMERATALLLPGQRPEPFGLVGIEAMQMGTAVIATNLGGVSEWLVEGETGETIPYGTSWCDAIESILLDPDRAFKMGRRARQVYQERFSEALHLERLITHLDEVGRPKYAPCSTEKSRQTIQQIVNETSALIAQEVPPSQREALLLTGSYGKGEGGIYSDFPHNDLDFLLITRGWRNQEKLKATLDELLDPLRKKWGIGLVLGVIAKQRLRRSKGAITWYETSNRHQLLLGSAPFLAELSKKELTTVPLKDIQQMLVNRGTLLILNQQWPEHHEQVIKHVNKAIIGLGDALLFTKGGYHWSYQERGRRIELLVPEINDAYQVALAFRFSPCYETDSVSLQKNAVELYRKHAPKLLSGSSKQQRFLDILLNRPTAEERHAYLSDWGVKGDPNFHKMRQREELDLEVECPK